MKCTMGRGAAALIFIGAVLLGAGYADTGYSGWNSTDGNRQIEYRWQSYGGGVTVPKCTIQLRNQDAGDKRTYDVVIDYVDARGGDSSFRANFFYPGQAGFREVYIGGCTRVTGAAATAR